MCGSSGPPKLSQEPQPCPWFTAHPSGQRLAETPTAWEMFLFLLTRHILRTVYSGRPRWPPWWQTLSTTCQLATPGHLWMVQETDGNVSSTPTRPAGPGISSVTPKEVTWSTHISCVLTTETAMILNEELHESTGHLKSEVGGSMCFLCWLKILRTSDFRDIKPTLPPIS